jgi:hypothetical protein
MAEEAQFLPMAEVAQFFQWRSVTQGYVYRRRHPKMLSPLLFSLSISLSIYISLSSSQAFLLCFEKGLVHRIVPLKPFAMFADEHIHI